MKKNILILLLALIAGICNVFSQRYTPGDILLVDHAREGEVKWAQNRNNGGGCSPTYNEAFPPGSNCGHVLVGCGAVAMGQIMWKWQHPNYNWDLMPATLRDTTAPEKSRVISNFLKDCAESINTRYGDDESSSFLFNVEDAFNNEFNYKSAKEYAKSDWSNYGSAWEDLIRSEINAGRPVFYEGRYSLFYGHFFVVDGYSAIDRDSFHINFGWRGNNNAYFKLNNINPPGHDPYNSYQHAIVGISPTLPNSSNENLYDVPYSSVSNKRTETARQNIALPASGKTLTVENGGDLTLIAGKSIRLLPGFHAKAGSKFVAKIDTVYQIDKEIRIIECATKVTPIFKDGINDYFWIKTENADSWEFQLFDASNYGKQIWATAGSIVNNRADVWNGIDTKNHQLKSTDYWYILRVKNNYGRAKEIAGHFTLFLTVPDCSEAMGITFTPLNSVYNDGAFLLSPNGDGINDEVCFAVNNVTNWEANLIDRTNRSLKRSGDASGQSTICVTDGRGFANNNRYQLQINYKGTNGCIKAKDYYVYIRGSTITRSAMVLEITENDSVLQEEDNFSLRSAMVSNLFSETKEDPFFQEDEILVSKSIDFSREVISDQNQPIILFPNPSKGTVFIRSVNQEAKTIRIYNTLGVLIHLEQESIQKKTEIDLSRFPNGVYTFIIEINDKQFVQKVVVNK